jgi:methyl-accepting chemotaxis protein
MTAKEQEEVVGAQENSIHEIERTAQEIAVESRVLANMMEAISQVSKEYTIADSAKSGLDHMQSQMLALADGSSKILHGINEIQQKVIGSENLMTFMSKISDQARMLSLNSAIETANVHHQKQSFAKITQEIQRFADKTSNSIHDIQNIINEITFNVATVRVEANICVNEIKEGVGRLISVNQQLTSITNQGREQVRKFESVNDVMQVQAFAAENIIESIRQISATAEENTKSIRSLHLTTAELAITATELQRVTGMFFKEKKPEDSDEIS